MNKTLQDRLAFLKAHPVDSWEEVYARLPSPAADLPEGVSAFLARLRQFDRGLYEDVFLAQTPSGDFPDFKQLCLSPRIKAVPYQNGVFTWHGEPSELDLNDPILVPLLKRAAAYLEARLEQSEATTNLSLNLLHLLIQVNPKEAEPLLLSLFQEADARYDLARCATLLSLLEEAGRLPDHLAWLQDSLTAFLSVRRLTATDYRETVYYLHRPELEKKLLDFVNHPRAAILNLYAMGGMGKTQLLRWFRGRYCAQFEFRIPCARVDFDLQSPAGDDWRPWHLLPDVVQQWSLQIARGPLLSLAHKIQTAQKFGRPILANFFEELVFSLGSDWNKPLILLIDTLEVLTLNHHKKLPDLIDLVFTMTQTIPRLKVVFSGRYALKDTPTISLPLPSMSRADAFDYLRNCRLLHQDLPLQTVVDKASTADPRAAGGQTAINPLKLSILADLLRDNPRISKREIENYSDAGVAYLVERVIDRIPDDDLKWMLRYAVVFRFLTRDTVDGILADPVNLNLRGTSGREAGQIPLDRAGEDLRGGDELPEEMRELVWLTKPAADKREMWSRLLRYAAEYSWVTADEKAPSILRLHPDVVQPMIGLLKRKHGDVYHWLHRAALGHYSGLAKQTEDEATWFTATREVCFHCLALEDALSLKTWASQVKRASKKGRPGWVEDLAMELYRSDFWKGLDKDYQAWQCLVVAGAHSSLAWQAQAEVPTNYVRPWLERYAKLGGDPDQVNALFAKIEMYLATKEFRTAFKHIMFLKESPKASRKGSRAFRLSHNQRRRLEVLEGEALLEMGKSRTGLALLSQLISQSSRSSQLSRRANIILGDSYGAQHKWTQALAYYREAARALSQGSNHWHRYRGLWADAASMSWQLKEAHRALFSGISSRNAQPVPAIVFLLKRVRYHLFAYQLQAGHNLIKVCLPKLEALQEPTQRLLLSAETRMSLALLYVHEHAQQSQVPLEQAAQDAMEVGEIPTAIDAWCLAAEVALDHMTAPNLAVSSLSTVWSVLGDPEKADHRKAAKAHALQAHIYFLQEMPYECSLSLQRAFSSALQEHTDTRDLALVVKTALILAETIALLETGVWHLFLERLGSITPPAARLHYVHGLRFWPTLTQIDQEMAHAFRQLLPRKSLPKNASFDLAFAHALRVAGEPKAEIRRVLLRAQQHFKGSHQGRLAVWSLLGPAGLDPKPQLIRQDFGTPEQKHEYATPEACLNLVHQLIEHARGEEALAWLAKIQTEWQGQEARAQWLSARARAQKGGSTEDHLAMAHSTLRNLGAQQEADRLSLDFFVGLEAKQLAQPRVMKSKSLPILEPPQSDIDELNDGDDLTLGGDHLGYSVNGSEDDPEKQSFQWLVEARYNDYLEILVRVEYEGKIIDEGVFPNPTLSREMAHFLEQERESNSSLKLLSVLAQDLDQHMRRLLPDTFWDFMQKYPPSALVWDLKQSLFWQLPWELAAAREVNYRRLPSSPATVEGKTPKVLLIRPGDEAFHTHSRPSLSNDFLERLRYQYKWECEVLDHPDVSDFLQMMHEFRPDILWIATGFRKHFFVALDFFGGLKDRSFEDPINAGLFRKAFSKPVFIVIDTPPSFEPVKDLSQSLLANEFSGDLASFSDGMVAGILGLGQLGSKGRGDLVEGIMQLMKREKTARHILSYLKEQARLLGANPLQRAGLNLWCDNLDRPLLTRNH